MSIPNRINPSNNINPASFVVLDVQIFDPPMCCPTGLCGPALDENLLDLNETIMAIEKQGYHVERYQMRSNPQAFLSQPEVMRLINSQQMAALPIVMVRGQVLSSGSYPKLIEIQEKLKGKKS